MMIDIRGDINRGRSGAVVHGRDGDKRRDRNYRKMVDTLREEQYILGSIYSTNNK